MQMKNGNRQVVKPGDYPLGSPESRAAARAQLAHRRDSRKRIEVISNICRPGEDNSRVRFGAWQDCPDGKLFRMVYVPHLWLKPGDVVPTCPDCRMPFTKTSEHYNVMGYESSCVDLHDPDRAA